MTTRTEIIFFADEPGQRTPYIHDLEPIKYTLDCSEGSITFDGYYYVEDHAPPYPEDDGLPRWERPERRSQYLPQILDMIVHIREVVPCKEEIIENVLYRDYKTIEQSMCKIEIYKRITHECTDQISEIDDDGEPMHVCFFPTDKQTIYFLVL